jgi:hypothetical protein
MGAKGTGYKDIECNDLAQDRDQWRAVVKLAKEYL